LNKINVGVTGYTGFIGYHLSTHINYLTDEFVFVPCPNDFFKDEDKLSHFVNQCDVIVHLAAMNRGEDKEIFETNIRLVNQLVEALENDISKKYVIFASTTQEKRDNAYGRSKIKGHEILRDWAEKSNGTFTTLIIPNVFGAFCKPLYNSVIATFCHQINHNEEPEIHIDAEIEFIYVGNLVEKICKLITSQAINNQKMVIKTDKRIKVSDILSKLMLFKESYMGASILPELRTSFDINLFNTFRSYIDYNNLLQQLNLNTDNRGFLFEIIKELTGGQVFFSLTKPGVIRGNHFHTRKIERFCVVSGNAIIHLRRIGYNKIIEYKVTGNDPTAIDIPIYHTHNIENIGKSDLLTLFWSNDIFNPEAPDTYIEKV
jgi:UDP-2-acetamido-2,6-beta-L-arabino-hexul-4-ose reductase